MTTCRECGTHNPTDRERCIHCGATLVNTEAVAGAASGDHDVTGDNEPPASKAGRRAAKTPGWLQALDIPWDDALTRQDAVAEGVGSPATPDWLKGLDVDQLDSVAGAGVSESQFEAQSAASGPAEIPEWLRGVEDVVSTQEVSPTDPAPEATLPWLAAVETDGADEPGGAELLPDGTGEAEPGTPSWLEASVRSEQARLSEQERLLAETAPAPAMSPVPEHDLRETAAIPEESERVPGAVVEQPAPAEEAAVETSTAEAEAEPEALPALIIPGLPEWLQEVDIAAIRAELLDTDGALREQTTEATEPPADQSEVSAVLEVGEAAASLAGEEGDLLDRIVEGEPTIGAAQEPEADEEEEPDEFSSWLHTIAAASMVRDGSGDTDTFAGSRSDLLNEIDQLFYGRTTGEPNDLVLEDPLPRWLDEVLQSVPPLPELETAGSPVEQQQLNELDNASLPDWLQADPLSTIVASEKDAEEGRREETSSAREAAGLGVVAAAAALAAADMIPSLGSRDASAEGDALHEAELPDWLATLRQEGLLDADTPEAELSMAVAGPLVGIPGVLDRGAAALQGFGEETGSGAATATPEQRGQTALLQQLDQQSPDRLPDRESDVIERLPRTVRLGLGLLLLATILIGLLGPQLIATELPASPGVEAVHAAVTAAQGQTVLVAFEYSPAMAGELSVQAETLLADLAAGGSTALLVSQSPAGITLGEALAAETPGLSSYSIGYIAGEFIGLRGLTSCLTGRASCETVAGVRMDDDLQQQLTGVALIIVLAAERDGLVSWIEQVGAAVEVPLIAGVTQAVAPVAAPYYQSGQITGVIAGLPALAVYQQAAGDNSSGDQLDSQVLWAYTLALWLVIALIVFGNFIRLGGEMLRRNGGGQK